MNRENMRKKRAMTENEEMAKNKMVSFPQC